MKRKKLTKKEIDQAVQKIRERYDYYMVRFIKNRRARDAFEERYRDALRSRIDLERFLAVEMKNVQELISREEDRQRRSARVNHVQDNGRNGADSNGGEEKQDFADRVIEKLKERAEKYPVIGLECREVWEVDHLFGAIQKLENTHWPKIDRIYRNIYPSRFDGPRIMIENRIMELAEARMGGVPPVLHPLQLLVGRFPRNYREIEWEVKQSILKAAFFLHMFKGELEKLRQDSYLADSDTSTVDTALEYVNGVIEDFRLKDLKQK